MQRQDGLFSVHQWAYLVEGSEKSNKEGAINNVKSVVLHCVKTEVMKNVKKNYFLLINLLIISKYYLRCTVSLMVLSS